MNTFKFGTVTVPDGSKGPWTIDTIDVTNDEVLLHNLRALRDDTPELVCKPGTYRRLWHADRGVIMSNTRMEIITAYDAFQEATGRVLINGLGLGMVLEGILSKPDVSFVRVIEVDADVIALVAPHFAADRRVEIIQADAYAYRPLQGEWFDYVWHDIWDKIDSHNLSGMAKLTRRYDKFAAKQGVWSRREARRMRRRGR